MDDPTTPSNPNNEASNFTANETKLICAIMQNLTSEIQFDAEKVALELGYKNGSSLRARWNSLKRSKITSSSTAPAGGVDKSTPSKKAKATPKKAKATDGEDGDGSSSVGGKKGGKKAGKKGKTGVKVEEDDDTVGSVGESNGGKDGGDFINWGS